MLVELVLKIHTSFQMQWNPNICVFIFIFIFIFFLIYLSSYQHRHPVIEHLSCRIVFFSNEVWYKSDKQQSVSMLSSRDCLCEFGGVPGGWLCELWSDNSLLVMFRAVWLWLKVGEDSGEDPEATQCLQQPPYRRQAPSSIVGFLVYFGQPGTNMPVILQWTILYMGRAYWQNT